ncbi:MAG: helix-turn-helix transcriptional regulator [Bacillales bacterium]|nr:helix-turn-helix transcriptional regulator [Bacillales bacterium]
MSFSFNKLWKLLIDNKLKKKDLAVKAKLSPSTLATMSKGGSVSLETLGRICKVLNCNIGDIVDVEFNESEVM